MRVPRNIVNGLVAWWLAFGSTLVHADGAFDFVWEGRLTKSSGAPLEGPVALTISFFHGPFDPQPVLAVSSGLEQVPLLDGIFQVKLALTPAQYATVFPRPSQAVYVQVTNRSDPSSPPFPRQQITVTPYAAKIPVDEDTLAYNDQGKLAVQSVPLSAVTGLSQELASRPSRADVESLIATTDATSHTHTATEISDLRTYISQTAAGDIVLSGDVSGTPSTSMVTGLQGKSLPTPNAGDTGKLLQFSGSSYSWLGGSTGSIMMGSASGGIAPANLQEGSTHGVTITIAPDQLALDTAQDIRPSATPVFAGVTATSAGIKTPHIEAGIVRGAKAPGADSAGSSLVLEAGKGSGTESSGAIEFRTGPGGTSGERVNDVATRMVLTPAGNLGITTSTPKARLHVATGEENTAAIIAQVSAESQIADLQQWQNKAGEVLSKVDKDGFLYLPGQPTEASQAATKQYVDSKVDLTDSKVSALSTTEIAEGNNLYFTQERARGALTATAPLVYSSSSGALSISGLANLGSANQLIGVSASGNNLEYKSILGSSSVVVSSMPGGINITTAQGIGPTDSPVFSGLKLTDLSSGVVKSDFTGILSAGSVDLATMDVMGTLPPAHGGTGQSRLPGDGQMLIGNGGTGGYELTSLAAGDSVRVTNGPGSVTIDTVQDLRPEASPSFEGVAVGTGGVFTPSIVLGVGDEAPAAASGIMRSANRTGTDALGTDLLIQAGLGTGNQTSGSILFRTATGGPESGTDANSPTVRMVIDPSGNIGVGTVAPNSQLDLYGTGPVEAKVTSTADTAKISTVGATGGVIANALGDQSIINNSPTGAITFSTASVERMRLTNEGRLGVGTEAPAARAHIVVNDPAFVALRVQSEQSSHGASLTEWVNSAGMVMSRIDHNGFMVLPGAPLSANHAVNKAYVDSLLNSTNLSLSVKEPMITMGSPMQYWRGDKTWQRLNTDAVPETLDNRYFTEARAKASISASLPVQYSPTTGVVSLNVGTGPNQVVQLDNAAKIPSLDGSQLKFIIPAGMVAPFNLSSCPPGWGELLGARGRVVVGLPSGGTLAGTVGTALSNLENRPVGQHNHGVTDSGHVHGITDPGHAHGTTEANHSHTITDPGHGHSVNETAHSHAISDPGHAHGTSEAAHSHPLYDPGHGHSVNEPAHSHGVSDPGHNHGINQSPHVHGANDWGHGHSAGDSGHSHGYRRSEAAGSDGNHYDAGGRYIPSANPFSTWNESTGWDYARVWVGTGHANINIHEAYANISLNGSGTGISIAAARAGISVNNSGTGVSMGAVKTNLSVNGSTTGVSMNAVKTNVSLNNNTTGLTMAGAKTNLTVNSATTAVSVNNAATGISINNQGAVAGTNAPYIQLLYCQKLPDTL